MDALAQTVINGYEFRHKVGAGGFGIVYRAFQPALGREVAIKVILPEHANRPEFVRRFEQEARLIARLEHPHIVPLYDYWQDASGAYLVMRWLPETLRERVKQGPLTLESAANLLDQMSGALNIAHRSGVIHRDIKPDNLLFDHQGNIYLADFGIAKVINSSTNTTSGQLLGSMAYLAPEQINDGELTPQSDLYSLGLVLYEMLTGVQPYAGASASALLQHHLQDPLPSLRTHRPELPAALDVVMATATAKIPTDRYEDAIRFARAFRAALPAPKHFQPLAEPLTERELEILTLLTEGLNNGEIAERLYLSLSTIKWYKKQIYSKLDVHNREAAIVRAQSLGLVSGSDPTSSEAARDLPEDYTLVVAPIAGSAPFPLQTTPLIGREAEVAALADLIRDPANRLVSVLAPGGMGKTRLALEVGTQIASDFKQGVVFIALNAVSEPAQMVFAVANAVGVRLTGQIEPKQQLLEHFRHQQVLLIFDNFEHLLDAVPLLVEILETAPQVKLLTTTRERLNLSGETLFPLAGLEIPSTDPGTDLRSYSAVRLFVSAAHRIQHAAEYTQNDLLQIGRICRLVGGMPLALLLAASWTDVLKVGEIADEISNGIDFLESQWRDLPERQHSIRAVFEASWRRLTPTEAEALARLAVFRGGFTRRAAEQVAGASLRTLSALVNKALLWMDQDGRCSVHELLRQYAAEQLELGGSGDAVRTVHSAYYLEVLAARESDLTGSNQAVTLNDIAADVDNVRVAVMWAAKCRDYVRLAAVVQPLWVYYFYSGSYLNGEELFGKLAAVLRGDPPSPSSAALLGDVLSHQAFLLLFMFERARADQCLAEAEAFVEASGNARIGAFYQLTQAHQLPWERSAEALPAARTALELYHLIGDLWGEAMASYYVGSAFMYGGQLSDDESREALDHARSTSEMLGDTLMYATTLTAFGLLLSARSGSVTERLALFEQVLAIRRTRNNPIRIANALINVSIHKAGIGRLADAARDLEEAVAIKRLQGSAHDTVGFDDLGEIYFRMGWLAQARSIFEEALGYVVNTEQHAWRNLYRLYLIEIAYAEGAYEQVETSAAEIMREDAVANANSHAHHHRMTYILGMAELAALARSDLAAAWNWNAEAERSAKTDPNRNGATFAQVVNGLRVLIEGDAPSALNDFETAMAYFKEDYAYDLSQDYERDLGITLALIGCSRAALQLDQLERAESYCLDALRHAQRFNVDAFALMALLPAAEIALVRGDPGQAAQLAVLVADHLHTFDHDRTMALRLLEHLSSEIYPSHSTLDLWTAVSKLADV